MSALLDGMTHTPQPHRIPFHRALYPVPPRLVARVLAAAREWLDREPVRLSALDRPDGAR